MGFWDIVVSYCTIGIGALGVCIAYVSLKGDA